MKKNLIPFTSKKVFLLLCSSLLGYGTLQADWNAEDFCTENNLSTSSLDGLKNPNYLALKEKVKKSLEKSWCSAEKTDLLMDLVFLSHPEVCVEIGAFTGSSVLPVAATLQYLRSGKVFAIDAWSNAEATRYMENNDPNKAWWSSVDMQGVYNMFQSMSHKWALQSVCIPIRSPAANAVSQVNHIDFLHLDGNYTETGSCQDIELYLPKVKEGGYILMSNLFIMINGKQPKLKAFGLLFDSCEMVAEIEHDNSVLFKKR